jgi:hypothetical protein
LRALIGERLDHGSPVMRHVTHVKVPESVCRITCCA